MDPIEEIMYNIEHGYTNKKNDQGRLPGSLIKGSVKDDKYATWMILTSKMMGPVDLMAIGIDQFKKDTWGGFIPSKDKRNLINYFLRELKKIKDTLPAK